MKNVFSLFLLFASLLIASDNYKKVKVFPTNKHDYKLLSEIGVDHYCKDKDGGWLVFISDNEYKDILNSGLQSELLIDDWHKHYLESQAQVSNEILQKQLTKTSLYFGVNSFDFGSMGGYNILSEVYEKLDEMYSAYPDLITSKEVIGTTNQSREIYFVKISDNPSVDESEPEVLYTALHHAREPESMMQMLYFMYYLLENYGTNPEVTHLVNNREMYFIPVVNPDGYEENRRIKAGGGGMHRKNMRANSDGSIGVDLNRNYGPIEYWNAPNGGSSLNPNNDTYRGTAPFSEPETAAVRQFLIDHEIRACLNYHTYGNLLIYPYGALARETPDSLIFREFASDMTQFNNYEYGTDEQTVGYTTRGNSDDYFYDGEVDLKGKIFAMTPEAGAGSDGFWPAQSRIIPLAEENVFPNLYYAWIVGGYITPTIISAKADYLMPGVIENLNIGLKNKGLENFGSFTVQFSTNSEYVELLQSSVLIDNLNSREEILLNDIVQIRITEDAPVGESIEIFATTFKNDIAMFTKSQKFLIGEPVITFSSSSEDFSVLWKTKSNSTQEWSLTDKEYFSDSSSITDSPIGNYNSNANLSFETIEPIEIKDSSKTFLQFNTKYAIENGWDYGQVLLSTDSGSSWVAIGGENSVIGSGQFQPNGQPMYSGRLAQWEKEEIDLTDFNGKDILVKFQLVTDEYLEMDGWYIDDINILTYQSTPTSVESVKLAPEKFSLSDNYPNPFNPTTTIEYTISPVEADDFSPVQLTIYDILGRLVATLVNENQKPGSYKVVWDAGSSLSSNGRLNASGVYYYQLRTNNFVKSKKMLLIK